MTGGRQDFMKHAFFRGIDWEKLEQKEIEAPYKPEVVPVLENPLFSNFSHMMNTLDNIDAEVGRRRFTAYPLISESDQKLFSSWNYISPYTLKIEMGIQSENMTLMTNPKAAQLTGVVPTEGTMKIIKI